MTSEKFDRHSVLLIRVEGSLFGLVFVEFSVHRVSSFLIYVCRSWAGRI